MFWIKQYIKMLLQNVVLPVLYWIFSRKPIQKGSVILADAHHEEIPFSMRRIYEELQKKEQQGDCQMQLFICDFNRLSFGGMIKYLVRFMKAYALAEYVIVCDYYLPVASCKKRSETKVIQLWHSCGLMKKIAYDAKEDIPKNYRGDMYGNYSVLTMSAEICLPVLSQALHMPIERIYATGVSRTDYYFDETWNHACREQFYKQYPEAKGKKIALWASTFRGNAARPYLVGLDEIRSAAEALSDEWYFVIKAHPHVDSHGKVSNCEIPTEELLPVADLMITDYSSIMFDYLLYNRPILLFAPDLEQYENGRGFYIEYRNTPYQVAENYEELVAGIRGSETWYKEHEKEADAFRDLYVGACDGKATDRILKLMETLRG